MEFKDFALGALVGVSLTMSAIQPAMAHPGSSHGSSHGAARHATITPIYCDECEEIDESGAYARFAGHALVVGMTDSQCEGTFVGARIDAPGFPADKWQITVTGNPGDPVFSTALRTSSNQLIVTDQLSSYDYNNGVVRASFNASALGYSGAKFVSIFVYDNGGEGGISFQDRFDLNGGVRVDGSFPVPNIHGGFDEDCFGLFGNINT